MRVKMQRRGGMQTRWGTQTRAETQNGGVTWGWVSVEEGVGQSTSIGTSRSVIIIDYVHVKVPNLNLLHACWIILVMTCMVLGSIA